MNGFWSTAKLFFLQNLAFAKKLLKLMIQISFEFHFMQHFLPSKYALNFKLYLRKVCSSFFSLTSFHLVLFLNLPLSPSFPSSVLSITEWFFYLCTHSIYNLSVQCSFKVISLQVVFHLFVLSIQSSHNSSIFATSVSFIQYSFLAYLFLGSLPYLISLSLVVLSTQSYYNSSIFEPIFSLFVLCSIISQLSLSRQSSIFDLSLSLFVASSLLTIVLSSLRKLQPARDSVANFSVCSMQYYFIVISLQVVFHL